MVVSAFHFYRVPYLPVAIMRHNEQLADIEQIIDTLILCGAEFLTFSDFVEKVQRLPRLGVKVSVPYLMTNLTSSNTLILGSFEGEVEAVVTTNNTQSTVEILGGIGDIRDYGGVHITATTYKGNPTFQEIYDLNGTDIWEIHKWDTQNNIYIIRTRKPLPGKHGLAIRITPINGAVSLRSIITYHI